MTPHLNQVIEEIQPIPHNFLSKNTPSLNLYNTSVFKNDNGEQVVLIDHYNIFAQRDNKKLV
jgi:hypothetical protein